MPIGQIIVNLLDLIPMHGYRTYIVNAAAIVGALVYMLFTHNFEYGSAIIFMATHNLFKAAHIDGKESRYIMIESLLNTLVGKPKDE